MEELTTNKLQLNKDSEVAVVTPSTPVEKAVSPPKEEAKVMLSDWWQDELQKLLTDGRGIALLGAFVAEMEKDGFLHATNSEFESKLKTFAARPC